MTGFLLNINSKETKLKAKKKNVVHNLFYENKNVVVHHDIGSPDTQNKREINNEASIYTSVECWEVKWETNVSILTFEKNIECQTHC